MKRQLLFHTYFSSYWIEGDNFVKVNERKDTPAKEEVVPYYIVKEALTYSDIDQKTLNKAINDYYSESGQIHTGNKALKATAYDLGVLAFKNGKQCVPAWDIDLAEICITGCQVGESIPYVKSWAEGWHDANLGRIAD